MDKIILNSSCNCCNDDENILKITSGNDFSIEIQLTIKEGDEWVVYDLSDVDADSLVVNVVSPTYERYEIDAAISSNKVVGVVDANVLEQYVVYGIEVIWRDDPYDKRAYGPRVFELVDSSLESTSDPFDYDSNSPYEYNLHINSDIAMLSIGQIPTGDFVTLEMLDEMSYVTQTSLNTTLSDYVQTSALDDYVTQTSLNTTLSDYVQTSALDDYVTDTELQDAIAGVTIDESNLVHKTGDENIGGTKTFANRILGQQGMTISHDILAQGAGVSHNLLGQYIRNGIQTGRISSSQIAVSEIIGPHTNSEYTSEERDAIKFCRNTANNERDIVLEQMAKIDVNGIYEGTTLLENKYLQIADLPTIPTATSDLTNDSGFITNSDLTTTLSDYVTNSSLTTTLSDYVTDTDLTTTLTDYVTDTDLQTAISGVTIDETNLVHINNNETITGNKNFNATTAFFNGNYMLYLPEILSGVSRAIKVSRGSFNQACIGQIITPNRTTTEYGYDNQKDTILFQKVSGVANHQPSLTTIAKIDSNGIYEGTTLLSNKYAQISSVPTATSDLTNDSGFITLNDLPPSSTVNDGTLTIQKNSSTVGTFTANQSSNSTVNISVPTDTGDLTNNAGFITLNDIPPIPNNVVTSDDGNEIICLTQSQYDTLEQNQQLESDVFYYITDATSNYVSQSDLTNYVTQLDLQTAISGLSIPTATSDLTNDSGFVSSSSVTTIWKGSQSDYNNISTPDANTLYIIV